MTSNYLVNSDEMQIKVAQGAKPGEGGELPGHKVTDTIADTRHSTPGVGLISPPPHHDIYSIEDLSQLIYDLKNANRYARVSVKLVSETGVGTIAAGVSKGKADGVLISGHDGGTGASPQASIKYAGLPWEIGLAETQQTLVLNDLRGRIRVQTDGGLKTGRDVVIGALLLGADEFGFSTAPLVAMGCILMRVCHLNTCPVGIATQQDPVLRERFAGEPESVVRYLMFIAEEAREYMAQLGFRTIDEMIGHVEKLDVNARRFRTGRAAGSTSPICSTSRTCRIRSYNDGRQTLDDGPRRGARHDVARTREAGARTRREGPDRAPDSKRQPHRRDDPGLRNLAEVRLSPGFPTDTITIEVQGQRGAVARRVLHERNVLRGRGRRERLRRQGPCAGGKIVVRVPEGSLFEPGESIIAGNVVLYGATEWRGLLPRRRGRTLLRSQQSGANAVVEGVGEHGCEYMTGGNVVILGPTGRNFAAGMSGGIAYVLDEDGKFVSRVNPTTVDLDDPLDENDIEVIQRMLRRHFQYTRSKKADEVLRKWETYAPKFVKVFPRDYKRALSDRIAAESGNG